jgi:type II secretory pathway pseudopilin PulG
VKRRGRGQAGFTLLMLLASVSIVLILLAVAVPSWRHVMQDDREQELLFRGFQIADAIQAYQSKNGNASPPSLEVLVKGKFLRKAFKDPMTKDGAWRLIHPGDLVAPITPPAIPGGLSAGFPPPSPSPSPTGSPSVNCPGGGSCDAVGPVLTLGPIVGVASRSTLKSFRLFNGRSHYNEWVFAVGQTRIIGNTPELTVAQLFGGAPAAASPPPPSVPGGSPFGAPSPTPSSSP